jgi:hypothetical protein
MKKHTLAEHLADYWEWYNGQGGSLLFPSKETEMIAWWTAYERWLNDRMLLTEEDDQVRAEPHGSERLAE